MTQEDKKKIKDYFKNMPDFASHYEKGNMSSWTFGTDKGLKIHTGDGGAKLMMEALEIEFKKNLDDISNNYKGLNELVKSKDNNSDTGVS